MTPPVPAPEPAAPEQAVPGNGLPESGSPSADTPADASADAPDKPAAPLPVEGDGYCVTLQKFEGPLDLLLYLIKRDEIDIYDIPISRITDQYLDSIDRIERLELDLDRAGEFLLMAATLMRLKARMLVPRDEEEEEEVVDPRAELVRRLLEYREFKRVAESLKGREDEWREIFFRAGSYRPEPVVADFPDLGVSLVDLFRAFGNMLEQLDEQEPFNMGVEEYSVDERMEFIREACAATEDGVPFRSALGGPPTRARLIATFLGLLELIRLREIAVAQVDRFGEIWIRPRKEDVSTI